MKPSLRNILLAAILGVLALWVAVGWYLGQREKALQTASFRNLQQWGVALNLFLIDNQNQLPETGALPITVEQKLAWYNALPAYLGRTPLADLPPAQRPRPGVGSLFVDPVTRPVRVWDESQYYFDYAMNQYLQPDPAARSYRIYELGYPANVVFLVEAAGFQPAIGPDKVVFRRDGGNPQPSDRSGVVFCDGHVRFLSRSELEDPQSLRADHAARGVSWFKE